MISRLLSKFFWHFYDHLGTYVFHSVGLGLVLLLLIIGIVKLPISVLTKVVLSALSIFAGMVTITSSEAYYCGKCFINEDSKAGNLLIGLKEYSLRYIVYFILYWLLSGLLVLNFVFYYSLAIHSSYKLLFTCLFIFIAIVFFFFNLLALIFITYPVSSVISRLDEVSYSRKIIFASIFIWPAFWPIVFIFYLSVALLSLISIIGIPLLLTFAIILSHAGCYIVMKQYHYLTIVAKEGKTSDFKEIKKFAEIMAAEEYLGKDRRSFREILKPWE